MWDEFDLLLCATLAGAYARRWCTGTPTLTLAASARLRVLLWLLAASTLLGLWRGFDDAGGFAFDWFAGYGDALNSVRVFKSGLYALLGAPLLVRAWEDNAQQAQRRLARGMVVGLGIVALAALWERAAFPGLLDFSAAYRTVALFWEMHVGGEAIDAYLVLASPFAVWAVMQARRPVAWLAAAVLALLTVYAVLTTFSRGVYFAVLLSLLLLGARLVHRHYASSIAAARIWAVRQGWGLQHWRTRALWLLALAVIAEVVLVLYAGSFMLTRLRAARDDLGSRLVHWQTGLKTLHGSADWLLGKGLGRLPASYASLGPAGEFSGAVRAAQEPDGSGGVNHFAQLAGPKTVKRLGGQFAITQRTGAPTTGEYQISFDARTLHEPHRDSRHSEAAPSPRHREAAPSPRHREATPSTRHREADRPWRSMSLCLHGLPRFARNDGHVVIARSAGRGDPCRDTFGHGLRRFARNDGQLVIARSAGRGDPCRDTFGHGLRRFARNDSHVVIARPSGRGDPCRGTFGDGLPCFARNDSHAVIARSVGRGDPGRDTFGDGLPRRFAPHGDEPLVHGPYSVSAPKQDARSATELQFQWCERHLLFDGHCVTSTVALQAGSTAWQSVRLPLPPWMAPQDHWYAPRLHLLSVSVLTPGALVDIDNLQLIGTTDQNLLANSDFSAGLAHWALSAQAYFLPWHIDNLLLELLIERGLIGLLLTGALLAYALWVQLFARGADDALAPYLGAALVGVVCVGMTSSVMDVPRVAFLLYLLVLASATPTCEKSTAKKNAHANSNSISRSEGCT